MHQIANQRKYISESTNFNNLRTISPTSANNLDQTINIEEKEASVMLTESPRLVK